MNSNKSSTQIVVEKLLGKERAQELHKDLMAGKIVHPKKKISIWPSPSQRRATISGIPGLGSVHSYDSFEEFPIEDFMWEVLLLVSIDNPTQSGWMKGRNNDSCCAIGHTTEWRIR